MILNPDGTSNLKTDYWIPHDKQIEFAQIPYSVFEGFYGGSLGGGKSELLLMLPILYKMHEHPRFHGIFFRRTLSQQDETLILRAKYLYGKVGADFNEQKRIFTFPSGAVIRYTYLERDEHARDHDGAEYHYVAFDELTHFSEFQYIYITTRIRRSTADLPVIIRSASNPGNIGHAWVRKRFIEPCKEGGRILKDVHGNKRIFIRSFAKDNPHLTKNDPEYLTRLQILPEAERRAKIEGDWWIFSGQVFTEFRSERFNGEPENAFHLVKPFKIPYYWPRIAALDWGYTANTYGIAAAISPDRRCYVYDEFLTNQESISKWGPKFARMLLPDANAVKTIFVDPSARKKDGQQENSIFEQIADSIGSVLAPKLEYADNDRLAGKQTIHSLLRWQPRPTLKNITPGGFDEQLHQQIFRNHGSSAAHQYWLSFQPEEPENNIPRLLFFEDCSEIIRTIPLCVYNEDKGTSRRSKKFEDVKEWNGDDPYDTLRYLCRGVDRYVDEVLKADKEFKTLEAIHNNFLTTGDQTSYYMAMRIHEQRNKNNANSSSFSRSRRKFIRGRLS